MQNRKCVTFHKCKLIVNAVNVRDALRDLVPFVQFKKREKQPWIVLLLVKLQALAWHFTKSNILSCVFFHVFQLVQMVLNYAKHNILLYTV